MIIVAVLGPDYGQQKTYAEYGRDCGRVTTTAYTAGAIITIETSHGTCAGCKREQDLVNGYCDVCRCMGANEQQVENIDTIKRKQQAASRNAKASPWQGYRL